MEKNLIEQYFERCDAVRVEFNPQIKALQQRKQEQLDRELDTFVNQLRELLPEGLRERVEENFSFDRNSKEEKHSMHYLIATRSEQAFGLLQLWDVTLSKEEISQMNKAWHPMVAMDPHFMSFNVQSTKRAEKFLNDLLEAGRRH